MAALKDEMLGDGILLLTLNRPDKLNALDIEIFHHLDEQLSKIEEDSNIKALIITGQGRAFCAGADIKRIAKFDAHAGYKFALAGQKLFSRLESLPVPSIAAVNGYALGGGLELALSTTIRIASNNAKFGLPEITLGLIPGYGGTQRLSRAIGKSRALEMSLSGMPIDAEKAMHWGLINHIVDQEQLLSRSIELLSTILKNAPLAIQGVLSATNEGCDLPMPEALLIEALHFAKVCATEDKVEGISAFLEKRKAKFIGK